MQFECKIKEETYTVTLDDNEPKAEINGRSFQYKIEKNSADRLIIRNGTKLYKIDNISIEGETIEFSINGRFVETTIKDEQELLLEKLGFQTDLAGSAGQLNAPMPGKILDLMVSEGDEIEENEPVIILEAMKMENELKSPTTGVVTSVYISTGDNVEKNQPLLEIEPRG